MSATPKRKRSGQKKSTASSKLRVRHAVVVKPSPPVEAGWLLDQFGYPKDQVVGLRYLTILYGGEPVGMFCVFPIHPIKNTGGIVLEAMAWSPYASPRVRLESAYAAGKIIGAQASLIGYSRTSDFKFFQALNRHGVIRKIGKQRAGFETMVTAWETQPALLESGGEVNGDSG